MPAIRLCILIRKLFLETHKVTKPIVVNLVRMLLKIRSILLWTLIR